MGNTLSCGAAGSKGKDEKIVETLFYDFFEKFKNNTDGDFVKIPKADFVRSHLLVENRLRNVNRQRKHIGFEVQILNTSDSKAAQSFAEKLQEELERRHKIESRLVDEPVKGTVILVICNKTDNQDGQQAVDKSLSNIKEEFFKSIILIVLHVKRENQLPCTATKSQLQSCKISTVLDMGFEDQTIYQCDKNQSAFQEIEKCCFQHRSMKLHEEAEPALIQSDIYGMPKDETRLTAYIVNPSETEASKQFVDTFQKDLEKFGIITTKQPTSNANNIEPDAFLIIVCNITSRHETDIERNLRDISCDKRKILILLHVVDNPKHVTHIIPNPDINKNIICIIEMLFTSNRGIYDCDMNRTAFAKLKEVYSTITKHDMTRASRNKPNGAQSNQGNSETQGDAENQMYDSSEEPSKKVKTEETKTDERIETHL